MALGHLARGAVRRLTHDEHPGGGDHGHNRRGDQRSAQVPAQRADDPEAAQQREEAGLREGREESGERHRDGGDQVAGGAPVAQPDEDRRREHDGERQVAAKDVRVPEQRVHPEVEVEVVRHLQLRVPEDLPRDVLTQADHGEQQRLRKDDGQRQREQPPVPARVQEQAEHDRERNEEEADVPGREVQVVRVGRLDRVEAERGDQDDRQRPRKPPHGPGIAPRRDRGGQDPRADHDVEGHEQVGVLPSPRVDRNAEGQRRHQQQREEHGPSQHREGQPEQRDGPHLNDAGEDAGPVSQRLELVPALAGHERQRQRHGGEQRGRPRSPTVGQERDGDQSGRHDAAEHLEDVAHGSGPSARTRNRSPEVATRSASSRVRRARYMPGVASWPASVSPSQS